LKLTGGKEMKNKVLIMFIPILVINSFLAFLLFKFNQNEIELKTVIILLVGSYVVYGILNLYLTFLDKTNQKSNFALTCGAGSVVCILSFIILLFNLKNDKILFFPMMYVFSMLCTFINWIIYDKKYKK